MREAGFYWVCDVGAYGWQVAEWDGDGWYVNMVHVGDSYWGEIDERRIVREVE